MSSILVDETKPSMLGDFRDVQLEEIGPDNKGELSEFISSRKDSSFVDRWEWTTFIKKTYGLESFWYVARKNGKIEGFLGLTLSNHPVFGRYLVTAPFASQGGFYAESEDAFLALIGKAEELQCQLHSRYTLIRHMSNKWDFPPDWRNDYSYANYQLHLDNDFDFFSKENIRGTLRNTVNKFGKNNLCITFGGFELVEDFWKVISRSMKELGSPYHSKRYLETMEEYIGSNAEFVLAKSSDGQIIGGGLLISHQSKVEILHMNTLKEYKSMSVADFLYWSTVRECYRRSVRSIDMGRSLVDSGNESYKMKWRPARHILCYSYHLTPKARMPNLNQKNPRFRLAIDVWQRMPLAVANFLGPRLISGIL